MNKIYNIEDNMTYHLLALKALKYLFKSNYNPEYFKNYYHQKLKNSDNYKKNQHIRTKQFKEFKERNQEKLKEYMKNYYEMNKKTIKENTKKFPNEYFKIYMRKYRIKKALEKQNNL